MPQDSPRWMLVAPAVLSSGFSFYFTSTVLYRSEEEARDVHGKLFVAWPAFEPIKVPYLEPRK